MIDTSHVPLQGFDPRYKELLLRGGREEFFLPCGTPTKAHRLQAMLCQFRARMKKHHGETGRREWEALYDCVVGKKPDDPSVLRFYPRHSEFDDILGAVPVPAVPNNILEDLEKEQSE